MNHQHGKQTQPYCDDITAALLRHPITPMLIHIQFVLLRVQIVAYIPTVVMCQTVAAKKLKQ